MASAVVPEVGYPHGHLGHLTADEDKALQDFKQLLAEKEIWKAGPPPSHDDQTLLRFLRARRFVVQDAFKQFKDTEDWRAANNLDILFDTIDIAAYEQTRQMYPQWIGRRDKRGIPVYLFQIRELDSKTVAEYEKSADSTYSKAHPDGATPPKLLRLFALYENLTRFVQPLCTDMTDRPHNQTPITLSTNIVDVSGVSLRQFWNLKSHMQDASQLATANYPETLDRIFIVGAPYFFSTVWGWIKRWFDPITVSKIFILSQSEVLPTLESFIDIENIPSQYGGKLEFKRGDVPNLDPAIRKAVTWEGGHTTFPPGPMYWRPRDDGRMECLAVGSIEQKDRKERIGTIPRNSNNKSTLAVVVEAEGVRTTAATPTGGPEDESKQLGGAPETTVAAAAPVAAVAPVAQVSEAPAPEVSPAPATAAGTDAPAQASNPTIVVADTPTTETTSASGPVDGSVQGIQNLTLAESKKENTVAA